MEIQFHIRGLNLNPGFRRRFELALAGLQRLIAVSVAAVVLEHRREDAQPFRAYVSLAVPGPDIHAEACDHTLDAAWLKVAAALRGQIERRKSRQHARAKGNGHLRARACHPYSVVGAR